MDEKSPLRINVRRGGNSGGRRRRAIWLSIFMAIVLVYYSIVNRNWLVLNRQRDNTRKYEGESLTWKPCDNSDNYFDDLECSTVSVPMDHFNTTNSGSTTFTIPLIRLRGKNATVNILLNPGGPGGSGVQLVYRIRKDIQEIIGEEFHLVGFDPRGINGSQPSALCYPDNETRAAKSKIGKSDKPQYSPDIWAWTENYVQACEEMTGEYGKYVNTPQTAADMNVIIDALGQRDMLYWGLSYGSLLRQTYATMFPDRCKRVIIDGVADVFHWYESLYDPDNFIDADNVLYGFFEECIKAGHGCPLYESGLSKDELGSEVMSFLADLKGNPINVYHSNTVYGVVDYANVLDNMYTIMFVPRLWYDLAESLAGLLKGNATDYFFKYGQSAFFSPALYDHNSFVTYNNKITGHKAWPQKREFFPLIEPVWNMSIFASVYFDTLYGVAQWRVPRTHSFKPQKSVEMKHPMLILSQRYDPTTPITGAYKAKATFADSRLVAIEGYGHCSSAMHSTCSTKITRQYLLHGTLPEEGKTNCEVDKPYFIAPGDKADIKDSAAQTNALEEDRLWPAQMALSAGIRSSVLGRKQ